MKKSDYVDMRRKLTDEYNEKIAKLDAVFAMFGGTPIGDKPASPSANGGNAWTHDISKRDAVRGTIKHLSGTAFTLRDVKAALGTHYPQLAPEIEDNTLSAILSKLAEKNEISIIRKKVGKSPAQYRLPGDLL